jgi:hypothetical protein
MEALAMPTVNRARLDQHQRVSPPRPQPSQHQPEQTVRWAKAAIRTNDYVQLVAEGKDLEQQVSTRRQGKPDRRDHPDDVTHHA